MKNKKIIKQLEFVDNKLSNPYALVSLDSIASEGDDKIFKEANGLTIKEAEEALKIVSKHLFSLMKILNK